MVKANLDDLKLKYKSPRREFLIPILQDIQESDGFLSRDSIKLVSEYLNLPSSKIYGVATFYNQFRFNPPGKFHIQVCRGTACHVKGSFNVLETLQRELKIKAGQTSRDGLFSIEVVACLGACGLAPVICMNGEFIANVGSEDIRRIVKKCRKEAADNE
jgi:NADH-quinone oxidoreductase subunit E